MHPISSRRARQVRISRLFMVVCPYKSRKEVGLSRWSQNHVFGRYVALTSKCRGSNCLLSASGTHGLTLETHKYDIHLHGLVSARCCGCCGRLRSWLRNWHRRRGCRSRVLCRALVVHILIPIVTARAKASRHAVPYYSNSMRRNQGVGSTHQWPRRDHHHGCRPVR